MVHSAPRLTTTDCSDRPMATTLVAPNFQASPERINAHLREFKQYLTPIMARSYYIDAYFNGLYEMKPVIVFMP